MFIPYSPYNPLYPVYIQLHGHNIIVFSNFILLTDEILHRIIREEFLELSVELCSKGFIMGNNEGRLLDFLDDIGHGVSLAGACDP